MGKCFVRASVRTWIETGIHPELKDLIAAGPHHTFIGFL